MHNFLYKLARALFDNFNLKQRKNVIFFWQAVYWAIKLLHGYQIHYLFNMLLWVTITPLVAWGIQIFATSLARSAKFLFFQNHIEIFPHFRKGTRPILQYDQVELGPLEYRNYAREPALYRDHAEFTLFQKPPNSESSQPKTERSWRVNNVIIRNRTSGEYLIVYDWLKTCGIRMHDVSKH
jgi:hypothetical protein